MLRANAACFASISSISRRSCSNRASVAEVEGTSLAELNRWEEELLEEDEDEEDDDDEEDEPEELETLRAVWATIALPPRTAPKNSTACNTAGPVFTTSSGIISAIVPTRKLTVEAHKKSQVLFFLDTYVHVVTGRVHAFMSKNAKDEMC